MLSKLAELVGYVLQIDLLPEGFGITLEEVGMLSRRVQQYLLLSLLAPFLIVAQNQNGGVSGTVMDPTGAVIQKAVITVISLGRQRTGRDGLRFRWALFVSQA
jgi:hypothetical protein